MCCRQSQEEQNRTSVCAGYGLPSTTEEILGKAKVNLGHFHISVFNVATCYLLHENTLYLIFLVLFVWGKIATAPKSNLNRKNIELFFKDIQQAIILFCRTRKSPCNRTRILNLIANILRSLLNYEIQARLYLAWECLVCLPKRKCGSEQYTFLQK